MPKIVHILGFKGLLPLYESSTPVRKRNGCAAVLGLVQIEIGFLFEILWPLKFDSNSPVLHLSSNPVLGIK